MREHNRIDNEGSTARDHLANERTFLAWVRTALGVMGLGVLFEKLVVQEPSALTTGVALAAVLCGAAMLVYAAWRYERVAAALRRHEYVVARVSPVLVGLLAAAVMLTFAWMMLFD